MTKHTGTEAAPRAGDVKTAVLYRMDLPHHTCPYGLKARHLLRSRGYSVEDHRFTTREETERFMSDRGVKTTPQVFIGGERIGGYDDLRRYFALGSADPEATSYVPVVAVFAAAAALAMAVSHAVFGSMLTLRAAEWFVAFAMVILAMLKLQDIERFSTMFLNYDLLAKRWIPYSYLYPFAEFAAGALMAGRALDWLSIPLALFIGTVGGVSVLYAVYVQKRELKCACVGGSSRVPLGFVSLTENLMMIAMALWMLLGPHA